MNESTTSRRRVLTEQFTRGHPVVIRRATVLTMDRGVLPDTDVLVRGTTIAAVGTRLPTPAGTAVIEYATIGGARALGLDHLIGSLTPGKRADLVLLRTGSPTMFPVNNPAGHVVFQAGRGDVDTVLVDGRVLKHRGRLVGVDEHRARRLVERSLAPLRAQIPDEEWQEAMNPPRR